MSADYWYSDSADVCPGNAAVSIVLRRLLQLSLNQSFEVRPFCPTEADICLTALRLDVDFLSKSKKGPSFVC